MKKIMQIILGKSLVGFRCCHSRLSGILLKSPERCRSSRHDILMTYDALLTLVSLIAIVLLTAGAASANMKARIKVSGGGTYDYIIIGEMKEATDGFDNAYDSLYPSGNMNDTYIMSYFSHPEWGQVKPEFRADIRSTADRQEWDADVYTNLANGTPLTMGLMEHPAVSDCYTITVEDMATGQVTDIRGGNYSFTVNDNNATRQLRIIATASTTCIDAQSQQDPIDGGTGNNNGPDVTGPGSGGSDTNTTVTSNPSFFVKRTTGATDAYYSDLQAAFNAALTGDFFAVQAASFSGSLLFNRNAAINLKGGYNTAFTSSTGYTTISGSLTISRGTVVINSIVIK